MRMLFQRANPLALLLAISCCAISDAATKSDILPRVDQRFQSAGEQEVPDFQRHVMPLLGRLGCNSRACHGSFQGRGGLQLSLFGYDFKADHEALMAISEQSDEPRVNPENPDESLVILKPTDEFEHEGGKRYDKGSWQYHVIRRWIEGGAQFDTQQPQVLSNLEITPSEILFAKSGQQTQLKVVAVWDDGSREDVTPLCRFQSNSDQVAKIDTDGLVTATESGDTHVVVFYDSAVVPAPVIRPVTDRVGAKYPQVPTPTKIDQLVVEKLRKLGIVPSELSSDVMFLRRVCLDLTGSLPAPTEIEAFLADQSPNKRSAKIESLLETPAYIAWWTTRLCDFTGNSDDQLNNVTPVRSQASQDWYDWIYRRVAENVPYDDLVEGIVLATSRQADQSYTDYCTKMSKMYQSDAEGEFADLPTLPHYWARRNFRQKEERVIGFAYSFLGIRIQCAQCHKHPFDTWSKDDFDQFSGFFTGTISTNGASRNSRDEYNALVAALELPDNLRGGQLRREFTSKLREGHTIPFPEVYTVKPRAAKANANNAKRKRTRGNQPRSSAKLLGGETFDLTQLEDVRAPLMEWLREKDNPFFARAFVNRVWANYFNVGIVEPPDDMSLANPPSNKALLDYLAAGFIEHEFDMKWLHREITNSRVYQLSWRPNETNRADEVNFSHSVPRRLPAEVAYDAVQQATATDKAIEAMMSDVQGRAISVPGAGVRRRSNNPSAYALTIFGRSIRESNCDCDRSSEASLLQTVFLKNDQDVLNAIDRRRTGWVDSVGRSLDPNYRGPEAISAVRRPANFEKQVKAIRARVKRLKEAGQDEQAAATQKKLAVYVRRFKAPKRDAQQDEPAEQVKPFDSTEIVRQAYLRTLSRYPDQRELERSLKHIAESENTIAGVRGLMWALLNTKEFIVNH